MQISTKSRYGLRAMVELAVRNEDKPVSLRVISKKQNISYKYLEQILPQLKAAGLVRSIQGRKGGYILNKKPEKVTALEIVQVLEGNLRAVDCVDNTETCDRVDKCVTRNLWLELTETTKELLESRTLRQLASKQKALRQR